MDAGVTPAVSQLVDDLHQNTWLVVSKEPLRGLSSVVRTRKGARQGCKIGALIFNVIYEYALGRIRRRASDAGILHEIEGSQPCLWTLADGAIQPEAKGDVLATLCDIEYVDDVLFMLMHADPRQLVHNSRVILAIILDEFKCCGLECNLAAGKTEVTLSLVGKGARKAKAQLFDATVKRHFLATPDGHRRIGVVREYKHVGTVRTASGSNIPDARAKASKCLAAYYPLAHRIFGNAGIATSTRLSLAHSLCFSRLFYGTDTWLAPHADAVRILNEARLRVLRQVANKCRFQSTGPGTDASVLEALQLLPTDLHLLVLRLRSVFKVLGAGPQVLVALMFSKTRFFAAVGQ